MAKHYMWKVTVTDLEFSLRSECFFQNKRDAENLVKITESDGNTAILNKWTWEVEVEERY